MGLSPGPSSSRDATGPFPVQERVAAPPCLFPHAGGPPPADMGGTTQPLAAGTGGVTVTATRTRAPPGTRFTTKLSVPVNPRSGV